MATYTTNELHDGGLRIYCKDNQDALDCIREALNNGRRVKVVNQYETFYGVGFDRWLREGIKDINCTIEVTSINQWEGYPWSYEIKPSK